MTAKRKRKRPVRRRIPVEIIIILLLILVVGLGGGLWYFVIQPQVLAQASAPPVTTGQPVAESAPAPDFTTTDLAGNPVQLSDYRGQAVVLNTWATWCAPCRAEMPDLEKLHQEYKDQGAVVLAVNIGESRDTVTRFIQDTDFTFTVLLDETTAAIAQPYRIRAVPTTYFIDREGQIASIKVGIMNLAEMKRRLGEVL